MDADRTVFPVCVIRLFEACRLPMLAFLGPRASRPPISRYAKCRSSAFLTLVVTLLVIACSNERAPSSGFGNAATVAFEHKRQCAEAGYRLIDDLRRYYATGEQAEVSRPVFGYSDKLNTCVCRFTLVYANHRVEDWIYDSLSGRDLAAYFVGSSVGASSKMSQAEFQAKERELFGQVHE